VFGHPSFRDESLAGAVLRSLDLSPADRATIAIARMGVGWNRGVPPRWVPHLLDRSLAAGALSLAAHLDEVMRRLSGHVTGRWGSTWRTRSANQARP
jgi:hypothetical protein